jgi:glutamyl-tRNA synthetase
MTAIKTRFAPSPTGFLHIGGVRTALFSWLYARHHGGTFLLRIEDTDRGRSTDASIQAILDGMTWLDLAWDEGPIRQMDRLDRYREIARRMLQAGSAYHCYCTREELEERRAAQIARGENPRYDGRCRDRSQRRDGVEPVVRFRNPSSGSVTVHDLVRGSVSFENAELDDLILLRSDGVPTFHFGVVVDDADMKITHVIRGDDHLPNTPRQINLYAALGWQQPVYAHLPMILGADGARLSKRHGAVNVLEYRDRGFLPQAMLNYLVRLGWSHGDQEIFSREEMIRLFDVSDVNPSASRFNPEKLEWLNQQYVMTSPTEALLPSVMEQLRRQDLDPAAGPPLNALIEAYRERAPTLEALVNSAHYLYADTIAYDEKAARQHLKPAVVAPLTRLVTRFSDLSDWRRETLHAVIGEVAAECAIGFGKIGQPLRVALTGGTVSPPIDVTLELVGRNKTLARLKAALLLAERSAPVS